MRTLPHVVRRGSIFHFRRVVPRDLRPLLQRTELVRSLETADVSAAKRRSRRLYLLSDALFETVRADQMLPDNQIALLIKDFYHEVLDREGQLRLKTGPIPEETRLARIAY
ncbi:DUF6538 domain-containing protein, partial [Pararhodospirillum oryzae]|uniref:DUF6538 domain-containing protein n=1 Tax=Pararhodospirillum oryzae TaxID=478448 RepID=UPI002ADE7A81